MIFILSLCLLIILIIVAVKFFKKLCKMFIPVILLLCIAAPVSYYCIMYYLEKKNFHSFDLNELKRQELIIQRIDFKKFFVYGTSSENNATDELHVYHVSGHANINFKDIESLEIDTEKSDFTNKLLRLNYNNPQKAIPFDIDVVINENNIYKVQSFESDEITVGNFKKDLIKPEMSQSQTVEVIKKELQSEFNNQIIRTIDLKKLSESDLYQTFLKRITEIITSMSDWEAVEIQFASGDAK